jgi:hypothetical protein
MGDRHAARVEASHAERIGVGPDGDAAGGVAAREPGVARGGRYPLVGVAVRVGDRAQRCPGRSRQVRDAGPHRPRERVVGEGREPVVIAGVEADLAADRGEIADLTGAEPVPLVLAAEALEQLRRQLLSRGRRQRFDRGERPAGIRGPEQVLADAGVEGALDPLPPEAHRPLERGAGEKERRRGRGAAENRQHDVDVGAEVVVEGDREREPLAPAPAERRLAQPARRDQAVAALQEVELRAKRLRGDGVTGPRAVRPLVADPVVDERDPGLKTAQPERPIARRLTGSAQPPLDRRAARSFWGRDRTVRGAGHQRL